MAGRPPAYSGSLPFTLQLQREEKMFVVDTSKGNPEVEAHWMDLSHVLLPEPITVGVGGWNIVIGQDWALCPHPPGGRKWS